MVAQKIVFLFWATTHPLFNKESAFIDIPSQPPPPSTHVIPVHEMVT